MFIGRYKLIVPSSSFRVHCLLFISFTVNIITKKDRRSLAGARDDSHLGRLEMEEAAIRVGIRNLDSLELESPFLPSSFSK